MAGAWSRCNLCKEEFSGLGPFDLHLRENYGRVKTKKFIQCVPPATVGLSKDQYGYWGGMEGAIDVRPAHAQVLECAKCDTMWERPKQKGRLPKFCDKCREAGAK